MVANQDGLIAWSDLSIGLSTGVVDSISHLVIVISLAPALNSIHGKSAW